MNKITPSGSSQELTRETSKRWCDYCGGPLNPLVYFCPACSKPYKSVEGLIHKPIATYYSDGDLIGLKAPKVWSVFWVYFGVSIGLAITCIIIFGVDNLIPALLGVSAGIFVITCVYVAIYWRTLVPQFKRIGLFQPAGIVGICALAPLLFINYWYTKFLQYQGLESLDFAKEFSQVGIGIMGQVLFIAVFPAITEEIAFRGLLQEWLVRAIKPWHGIVVAAALFTAMHLTILSAPYLFAVGLLLGWTKWKTKSLYPPMLIHGIHNMVVVLYFWN